MHRATAVVFDGSRPTRRERYPIPAFGKDAFEGRGLIDDYHKLPPYQQTDYPGWISDTRREETRQRGLIQMLQQPERGGIHMKTWWRGDRSAREPATESAHGPPAMSLPASDSH